MPLLCWMKSHRQTAFWHSINHTRNVGLRMGACAYSYDHSIFMWDISWSLTSRLSHTSCFAVLFIDNIRIWRFVLWHTKLQATHLFTHKDVMTISVTQHLYKLTLFYFSLHVILYNFTLITCNNHYIYSAFKILVSSTSWTN